MAATTITRFALVGALALGAAGTTGCESGGSSSLFDMGTNMASQLMGDWNLSQFQGVDVASLMPEGMSIPSLNIGEGGDVSGSTGLNRFTSGLDFGEIAKGNFDLGNIATTKMGGSSEAMGFERAFLQQLEQVTGFNVGEDTLTLLEQGKEVLSFVRG